MGNLGPTAFGLMILLGGAMPAASTDVGANPDVVAIESLISNLEAANNAGDVERWVAHFAEDAVYMPPGSPEVTTRAELIEVAEAGFRHDAAVHIEPVEIHVAGDWAFARTKVTGTVTLEKSRDVVPVDVKQLVVYQRDGKGVWRIARMISNSNTP